MKDKILRFLLALKPHMVHACVRCGNTAGFWVMARKTVRRPWCLSCLDETPEDVRIISFDGIECKTIRR